MAILLDADRAEQLKAGAAPAVAAEETGKRKPPETKPNKPFNASRLGLYIDSKRFNIKAEFPSRYFTSSPKKPKLLFICFSLLNHFKVFKVYNLCGMDVYQITFVPLQHSKTSAISDTPKDPNSLPGLANTARVSPGLVGTPFYNPMNVSIFSTYLPEIRAHSRDSTRRAVVRSLPRRTRADSACLRNPRNYSSHRSATHGDAVSQSEECIGFRAQQSNLTYLPAISLDCHDSAFGDVGRRRRINSVVRAEWYA
ncbi:hypothetical protein C8R43DRAFT_1123371 [Mycena crocata]|nr:hypothetical protein C8R43DRAFT_1123371 [Mycena crocata]